MSEMQTGDIQLFNLSADDHQLHANLLLIHEDDAAAPSCTAVHIGHFLRHDGSMEVAFPSGNYVTTSPFRIETSRLGKPFDQVTREDVASLRQKYELSSETQFSILLRKNVASVDEATLNSDIAQYAIEYHKNREQDIEQAFLDAVASFQQMRQQPNSPVTLYFGLEDAPVPAESVMLTRSEADEGICNAYAMVWLLANRAKYKELLSNQLPVDSTFVLQVHAQADGTFCIGVGKQDPLMLLGSQDEFAHFHRVAGDLKTAKDIATRAGELVSAQWGVQTNVELLSQAQKPTGGCGGTH